MELAAGIGPLGVPELIIIAFIVILIFGVGRLPEVGGAVGRGIREFRKATKDDDESSPPKDASALEADMSSPEADVSAEQTVFCTECGAKNTRGVKFCASCGHEITAGVS
jgi:sec-independent protein translocase protein TatA